MGDAALVPVPSNEAKAAQAGGRALGLMLGSGFLGLCVFAGWWRRARKGPRAGAGRVAHTLKQGFKASFRIENVQNADLLSQFLRQKGLD